MARRHRSARDGQRVNRQGQVYASYLLFSNNIRLGVVDIRTHQVLAAVYLEMGHKKNGNHSLYHPLSR